MADDRDPFTGEAWEDMHALVGFIEHFEHFMDDLFEHPPSSLQGEELDQQREAWTELRRLRIGERMQQRYAEARDEPRYEDDDPLRDHGLRGTVFAAKLHAFADRYHAWRRTRTVRRLNRVAEVGGSVMSSLADALGWGSAYKEAIQGVQYLSGIVLSEGG